MGRIPTDERLRLRFYRDGDLQKFTPSPGPAREFWSNAWDWSKGPPGPTWTLYRWSGEVLGVGGCVRMAAHWTAWSLLGPLKLRDWPQALWHAERALGVIARHGDQGTDRERTSKVVAACRKDLKGGVRVLQRLGFELAAEQIYGEAYVTMQRRLAR